MLVKLLCVVGDVDRLHDKIKLNLLVCGDMYTCSYLESDGSICFGRDVRAYELVLPIELFYYVEHLRNRIDKEIELSVYNDRITNFDFMEDKK